MYIFVCECVYVFIFLLYLHLFLEFLFKRKYWCFLGKDTICFHNTYNFVYF